MEKEKYNAIKKKKISRQDLTDRVKLKIKTIYNSTKGRGYISFLIKDFLDNNNAVVQKSKGKMNCAITGIELISLEEAKALAPDNKELSIEIFDKHKNIKPKKIAYESTTSNFEKKSYMSSLTIQCLELFKQERISIKDKNIEQISKTGQFKIATKNKVVKEVPVEKHKNHKTEHAPLENNPELLKLKKQLNT